MALHVLSKISILRRVRTIAELGTVNVFICTQEIQKLVESLRIQKNSNTHAAYLAGLIHGTILRSRKQDVLEDMIIPLLDNAIKEAETK